MAENKYNTVFNNFINVQYELGIKILINFNQPFQDILKYIVNCTGRNLKTKWAWMINY